jgi:hypothetical protein
LAFARAGQILVRYLVVGVASFLVALFLRRRRPAAFRRLGEVVSLGLLRDLGGVAERVGRLLLAALLSALVVWPEFDVSQHAGTETSFAQTAHHLRLSAWLCLVTAWTFHLIVYHRREVGRKRNPDAWSTGTVDTLGMDEAGRQLKRPAIWAAVASA